MKARIFSLIVLIMLSNFAQGSGWVGGAVTAVRELTIGMMVTGMRASVEMAHSTARESSTTRVATSTTVRLRMANTTGRGP